MGDVPSHTLRDTQYGTAMRVGIHLPQYGRVAGPDAIRTAAQRAEQLGFADVWISDHIVHPAEQSYPSPYLYDPLATLAFAAAVTGEIGLGTSVLVLPQHNPLELANVLASTDALSKGRVTLGIGVGWSQREFEALGYDFENRGRAPTRSSPSCARVLARGSRVIRR